MYVYSKCRSRKLDPRAITEVFASPSYAEILTAPVQKSHFRCIAIDQKKEEGAISTFAFSSSREELCGWQLETI